MNNQFYSSFDTERWESPLDEESYRSSFQVDRDRILFSYAFRRLQSKTQVFQPGQFDFYRTRLTHSIEVARISRSIAEYLNQSSDFLGSDFYIDTDLVEAVGLSHDLGHPPFGHAGEYMLNQLMLDFGGFEGNAQTLELITRSLYQRSDGTAGMNPSRAFVDGIMKYKSTFSELKATRKESPKNHFIYDSQSEIRSWVLDDSLSELSSFDTESYGEVKSIECQIMDWADDTAYSLHDILDGIKTGFLTRDRIERWGEGQVLNSQENEVLKALFLSMQKGNYEAKFARKVGDFIHGTQLICEEGYRALRGKTHRYDYKLGIDSDLLAESRLYKKIAGELIFQSQAMHRIEFKSQEKLKEVFKKLVQNYQSKHPKNLIDPFSCGKECGFLQRYITNVLADMTDRMLESFYRDIV